MCVRSRECYGACSGRSRAFYSIPLVKHSLEIALAIATSAAVIKAAEICSSESGERQLKIRQVKRESERGWAARLARGWGAAGGCRGLHPPAPSPQHPREGGLWSK